MDNQYNYYNPNQEDTKNIFDEPPKKPKHKMGKFPKWLSVSCMGLLFGLVASAAFLTSNMLAGRVLGISSTDKEVKQAAPVNNSTLTKSSGTVTSDVSGIVDTAMPSVVSITNMSVQEVQNFFGGIQEQESQSVGSGSIIGQNDTELLIVTNNHVVEGSNTLTVTFIDDESVEANIKGTDPEKDLAVLAVPIDSLKDSTRDAITVMNIGDSNALKVGEPVIAIGNALGYGQSVTTGVVSALNRELQTETSERKVLQTDAAINPGNSGGALLNANGEMIGINTAKVNASVVQGAEGIGYAIPVSDVSEILTTLMNKETRTKVGEDQKGYLGIQGYNVTSDSAEMYGMPIGVFIAKITSGGGAEKAGLVKGTIITSLDGTTIDSMETLQEQLQYYKAGEKVELTVQIQDNGGYKEQKVSVTLGAQVQN